MCLKNNISVMLLLSTHSHDPCSVGESDVPACGPPASFSVHLASSAVTLAGSVHKSRADNVGAVEEMICVVCVDVTEWGMVVMDVFWRQLCVSMI